MRLDRSKAAVPACEKRGWRPFSVQKLSAGVKRCPKRLLPARGAAPCLPRVPWCCVLSRPGWPGAADRAAPHGSAARLFPDLARQPQAGDGRPATPGPFPAVRSGCPVRQRPDGRDAVPFRKKRPPAARRTVREGPGPSRTRRRPDPPSARHGAGRSKPPASRADCNGPWGQGCCPRGCCRWSPSWRRGSFPAASLPSVPNAVAASCGS